MKNKKNILLYVFVFFSVYFIPNMFYIIFHSIIQNKVLLSIVCNMLYACLLFIIFRKTLIEDFKKFKSNFKSNIKYSFRYWLIGIGIMMISNIIINVIIMNGQIAANEQINRELLLSEPLYVIISSLIFAPFVEELVYRLSLKHIIGGKYFPIISALLFGFCHILVNVNSITEFIYIIPYGALGYCFALMYKKTDSIWSSIFMHFIHNLVACSLILLIS